MFINQQIGDKLIIVNTFYTNYNLFMFKNQLIVKQKRNDSA